MELCVFEGLLAHHNVPTISHSKQTTHSDDYNQMRTEDEGENNQRGSENKNGKDTISSCTGICCDLKNGHGMELDPTVSRNVSANSWLTVGQQLTDCRWTVGRLLGDKATNNENTNHALVMSPPCIVYLSVSGTNPCNAAGNVLSP
ncbi:hypothetical protein P5673_023974 [Acropora cervicornis]|uniref:Uncharacterized protein n=1 Tax=Acropora cervicornis TaxID=6130 RepID=A0AAD9UYD6_ACRCE|nr:hypothetical protein P5673_023974 [Acropora cervicornis]